jgi:peptidoglycan/LPS O-acetylase OafA/YrhL
MTSTTAEAGTDAGATKKSRLPSLTGVRFYAALAVTCAHLLSSQAMFENETVQIAFGATVPFATSSVSMFFVLSGFVLAWSVRPTDTAGLFYRRRLVKIFPNHIAMWALAILFLSLFWREAPTVGYDGPPRWDASIANLFLVHGWVPNPAYISSANAPAWSLACEMFFYLLFPLLFPLIQRIPRTWLWRSTGATVLASLAVPCLALLFNSGPNLADELPIPVSQLWFGYLFPLARLPEFVLGMLLARLVGEQLWRVTRLRWAITTMAVSFMVSLALPPIFLFGPFYAAGAGMLVATLANRDVHDLPSRFRSRTLVYLGDRSYALYMCHFVVIGFIRQLFFPEEGLSTLPALAALFLIVLPITLLAHLALYALVEHPIYRRFASPRRAAKRADPAAERQPAADRADAPRSTTDGEPVLSVPSGASTPDRGNAASTAKP